MVWRLFLIFSANLKTTAESNDLNDEDVTEKLNQEVIFYMHKNTGRKMRQRNPKARRTKEKNA